ncbi:MAG TPA: phosphatidylserine decarboxylase, partial [Pseudomonas sp.]|nr:phosphatidylserine decarboxylase [Pseudomonas sp.]
STVILLFGPDRVSWAEHLGALTPVRMGEGLGQAKSEGDIVAPPPVSPQV